MGLLVLIAVMVVQAAVAMDSETDPTHRLS
jgi:hypothetical protein